MRRETIAYIWVLGILILAFTIFIPIPWVEVKEVDFTNPPSISYWGSNPATDISSENEPIWTTAATVVLVCAAIITGILFLFSLFRWTVKEDVRLWYWGEITICLIIIALIVFNNNSKGIFGHEITATSYISDATWYPYVGFYLVIASVIILTIGQFLVRRFFESYPKKQ